MKKITLILFFLPICFFGQQTVKDSIIHDNVYRSYRAYIPAIYNSSKATPLLFNFHGLTGSSFTSMWQADFRQIADTANFIIIHPQGLLNSAGQTHWNIGQIGTSINDINFISALLDSLSSKYNIDLNRVYSTGMSNGAYMSYRLACELSEKIAAIAPVAGSYISYMLTNCNPSHPTPVLHIHGDADSNSIYYGKPGVESIPNIISYWVNYNQCDTQSVLILVPNVNINDSSTVEHYSWKNGINGVDVEHLKVINGGHTWPGSNFSSNNSGIINYDINASIEIWRFLSKYDINGLINQPTNINEFSKNKKLVKIVDLLGRERKNINNKLLLYIYDNGEVVKKINLK